MPPPRPHQPSGAATLPHRAPREGRDYWVLDDALPNAREVRERSLARADWALGFPHRQETWPGMRTRPALLPEELASLEAWVKARTGAKRLWQERAPDGAMLDHNVIQVVGEGEAGPRPHTDSKKLCRYAAVLYLSPGAPSTCGTSFYRVRLPNGQLGGNIVPAPHHNLVEALGARFVAPDFFVEDVRVDNRFNRLLLYRADLIHSASAYCGRRPVDRRMTALFFWMA